MLLRFLLDAIIARLLDLLKERMEGGAGGLTVVIRQRLQKLRKINDALADEMPAEDLAPDYDPRVDAMKVRR